MNVLRTFATAVFICMIFYGILMHFVPNGAMSSSFKTTVSIALIASVIVSAGAAMKFDIGDIKYSGKGQLSVIMHPMRQIMKMRQ